MTTPSSLAITQGQPAPPELLGELRDSTADFAGASPLPCRLDDDGYVFLRSALDRNEVLAARREVFEQLEAVGEIRPPAVAGIATGQSRRSDAAGDLGVFWKSVSEGPALRRVTHGPRLHDVVSRILGEPARAHDYHFLRPAPVGRATDLHFDFPFFAGRASQVVTAWIPLGDVPISDGPLMIVEGSHRFHDLVEPMRQANLADGASFAAVQQAAYQVDVTDTLQVVRNRKARLLTTHFRAGDLIVFGGFTMHGSLDNHSPVGRVRLSCDVRYQPARDPADDPRYFGPNPTGAKGGGYGDMKAAQPLTTPWAMRQ